jgi:hypothetical protein
MEIPWVKLIAFKDYPALLISNMTIAYQARRLVLDLRFGLFASLRVITKTIPKKMYGYNGNSFVCVVEFGPKIKASHYFGW